MRLIINMNRCIKATEWRMHDQESEEQNKKGGNKEQVNRYVWAKVARR